MRLPQAWLTVPLPFPPNLAVSLGALEQSQEALETSGQVCIQLSLLLTASGLQLNLPEPKYPHLCNGTGGWGLGGDFEMRHEKRFYEILGISQT